MSHTRTPSNTPVAVSSIPSIQIPLDPLPSLSADLAPTVSKAPMATAQWPGSPLRASTHVSEHSWRYVPPPRKWAAPLCVDCGVNPCISDDDCGFCRQCYDLDIKGLYAIFAK